MVLELPYGCVEYFEFWPYLDWFVCAQICLRRPDALSCPPFFLPCDLGINLIFLFFPHLF